MLSAELVEEREVDLAEILDRRELDDRPSLVLEQDRQEDDRSRRRAAERGVDRCVVRRHVTQHDPAPVLGALAEEALAELDPGGRLRLQLARIGREKAEPGWLPVEVGKVEDAALDADERGELGEDHPSDRLQVALALEHLPEPGDVRLEPVDFMVPSRRLAQVANHLVDVVLEELDLALGVDLDRSRQVAASHRRRDLADGPHLCREIRSELVDRVGQILPGPPDAADVGLAAELALGADLAGNAGHLRREGVELVDHRVDRVLELENLAPDVDGDLLAQVAPGDGRCDVGDVANLGGQVVGHRVDVVGQVLPGAGHAADVRLAAELAFGAHLASDAGDLGGEGVELVDHRVDRVLLLEEFAPDVDGDLLAQVAPGDGGRDVADVAGPGGEVAGHRVDVVGEVLPGAGDAANVGLAAELALGADLVGDAGHLGRERVELVDHSVDRVLELEDLASDVDRDLLAEVAAGDGGRHLGDVPDLGREIGRHRVDRVGEVLARCR